MAVSIKSAAEIEKMRVAGRLTAEVLEMIEPLVQVGITTGELDRIFERFYRVDPARSRDTGGTGLGLAIVKHVCANHGGDCDVWSKVGEGSTFTIRLPALTEKVAKKAATRTTRPRTSSTSAKEEQ